MRLILFVCAIAAVQVLAGQGQGTGFEHTVTRDITTPVFHVFDPKTVTTDWVSVEPRAMPLPGAMSEKTRKAVDAEREAYEASKIKRRGNYSGSPTNPSSISVLKQAGYEGSSGSGTPNDNSIAVSNTDTIINVLNTTIRIYDRNGKYIPGGGWGLDNFLNRNKAIDTIPTMTRTYDPRVLYDPIANRFIVLFMHGTTDQTSFIVVGFSSTSNPLDPWYVYKIPGKPTQDSIWSDYPIVVHNRHDVFFTVNLIGNGASWEEGFTESVIWQLDKESGYAGKPLKKNVYTGIKYNGQSLRSICSIQNGPLPNGTDNYFVTLRPIDKKNDTVFMLHIDNTQKSGQAKLHLKQLKTDLPYGFPPSALQPDTAYKLRTNDTRALSGIRVGNTIQYLQNTMNFQTYQAHLQHTFIHGIHTDNPVVKGRMLEDDSLEFGYPAIASAGNSADDQSSIITFVYSGKWDYPGVGVIYHNRYGEYSAIEKIKKGDGLIYYSFIPKGEQRWGDYEGIQAKYNEPGVFYLVGSYGKSGVMYAYMSRVSLKDNLYTKSVADVKVFPNPAQEAMYIEIRCPDDGNYRLELYGMNGEKIREKKGIHLDAGTNLLRINPSDFAPGMYVLKIFGNSGGVIHSQKVEMH